MEIKTLTEIWTAKNENSQTYVPLFNIVSSSPMTWNDLYRNNNRQFIDHRILTLYGDRKFAVITGSVVGYFDNVWKGFEICNNTNWEKAFLAMNTNYNPLENYDKTSTITTTKSGSEKVENVIGQGKTSTIQTIDTELSEVSPESNNSFYNKDKATITTAPRETTTDSRTDSSTTTYGLNNVPRKDEVVENTSGNIGVTTSQQMLQSEFDIRMRNDFLMGVFTQFVLENTY